MKSNLPTSVSVDQWLGVWNELVRAYYGHNGYGGNTAEIYSHTLQLNSPAANAYRNNEGSEMAKSAYDDQLEIAKDSLIRIAKRFEEEFDCICLIDNQKLDDWDHVFDYRVEVTIESGERATYI